MMEEARRRAREQQIADVLDIFEQYQPEGPARADRHEELIAALLTVAHELRSLTFQAAEIDATLEGALGRS
jgi:hypothetical protein